ncbi:MAG: tRNA (N(6)-L-threonylcarbamoyladenosine(37)-C(2))-methylthiotransferase MtaB [Deltaproteobacteria bacterium]|nr:tRNA (N(6)-L-threonylcarbamoyladenosine(37)-C(2))-methylthiotransferase MtaB [Deltaproteobacteria bacterium]
MKTFLITTLGCRVNQSESEALAAALEGVGLIPNPDPCAVDLCIINTCAVTSKAAMQSRQAVRRMIRSHAGARIIVTGCNAQVAFEEMASIPGVDAVILQSEKERLPDIVSEMRKNSRPAPEGMQLPENRRPCRSSVDPIHFKNRARPYLKIQDGCNAVCTYCIVPRARGPGRSLPPPTVLQRLRQLKDAGYPEAVLTGIHLGSYGSDLENGMGLVDLLQEITSSNAPERIRLSSIEPNELPDALIELAAASKTGPTRICPHFHLPLQSGDDAILRRMGRPYNREMYRDRVLKILSVLPESAVGADVMAGFPGETESAFERTLSFVESLPLAYLHVFPFSPRPGTPAARFRDRVDSRTIRNRCRRLRDIGRAKRARFYAAALGQTVDLVMERKTRFQTGFCRGISDTYIPVWLKSDTLPAGMTATARIDRVEGSFKVFGTVVQENALTGTLPVRPDF